MSTELPCILILPKWYPNRFDAFDGNFVENHLHAIKKIAKVVVLFVHSDDAAKSDFEFERKKNQGIEELRVYFKKADTGISFLDKLLNALRYKKAQELGYQKLKHEGFSFDLSHVHVLSRTAYLAIKLLQEEGIPYGITEHWSGYLKERNDYHGALKKWFTQKAVKYAAFVTTVSTYLKESMQSHNLHNEYSLIPNVVDENLFQLGERNPNQTEVLFVGNLLQKPKRILDIIEVFSELKHEGEDFILNIYGEGVDESQCRELIKTKHLEDTIFLRGTAPRNEIGNQMGKAAFLILFSQFENQPCVISEAQASGIPVVVPNLPGIEEFINKDLGLLFTQNNREEFKLACKQMLNSYKQYDREKIRAYAVETFGEEVIAQKFQKIYAKHLSKQ